MVTKRMSYLVAALSIAGLLFWGWKLTSRSAYESAEYVVLKQAGSIELREYPDLMLVTTEMNSSVSERSAGNDGSFGRLFRYISGGNESNQKVAMTTPVFMDGHSQDSNGRMGFVLPKEVADSGIPEPGSEQVQVAKRAGGKFAVIRFSGRVDRTAFAERQAELEAWIDSEELQAVGEPEVAGYDPPWTPGPVRRNEILIRVEGT